MPTAIDSNSDTAVVRRRTLPYDKDKRRGRSRSPSAYLKKSGKSLRGFFGKSALNGKSSKNVKKALEWDLDPPTPTRVPTQNTTPPPPRVIPTTPPPPVSVSSIDASEEPKDVKETTDETVSPSGSIVPATSAGSTTSASPPPEPQAQDATATTDDASPTTTQPATTNKAQTPGLTTEGDKESVTVRVILLLMDPQSRRFELLQLEFDSAKAIVEDLLSQIPSSATDDTVRNQTYDGICTIDGVEMTCTRRLRDFVEGCDGIKSVVLAMPTGRTAEECVTLARPILSDPKVVRMVEPDAIPMVDEEEDDNNASSEPIVNNESNNDDDNNNIENTTNNNNDDDDDDDDDDDNVVTSPTTPEEPPTPTALDDTPGVADETTTPTEESPTPIALDDTPAVAPLSPAVPAPTENKSTHESITSSRAMPKSTPKSIDDGSASTLSKIALFFALLLPIILKYQKSITNPLSPGDELLPGDYRSRCGLKVIVPSLVKCEHEETRLHFDKDGSLTLYRGPSEVVWQVEDNCDAEAEADCRLMVGDDGSVLIQGQIVPFNKDMVEVSSPWPFVLDIPVTKKAKRKKRGILGRNK